MLVLVASCGPKGRLAVPEQNVVQRFEVSEGFQPSYLWALPGTPATLTLAPNGPHEMFWSVSEKAAPRVRRSRLASLQRKPRFFSQGPDGVREVRFSPSGRTILAQEFSADRSRFQTLIFQQDETTGAWRSRTLNLGQTVATKSKKLDDGSRVASLIGVATAPRILRLDEDLVIYQLRGETQSLPLSL